MTYELWDLVSRNMIDWFEDRDSALQAVHAYIDADEADLVLLIVRDESGATLLTSTGQVLADWATGLPAA